MIPRHYNPLTDFSLAHDAAPPEIDDTFKSLPWCKNLHANGQVITRDEWRKAKAAEQAVKNGKA